MGDAKKYFLIVPFVLILVVCLVSFSCAWRHLPWDGGADGHNIGINLFASQLDWVDDRLFADVMKMARPWTDPLDADGQPAYGGGAPVPVDAQGWPTTDAECVVWAGIDRMHGMYRLEGECAVKPEISLGYGSHELSGYEWAGGRFSADIMSHGQTDSGGLLLGFTGTSGGVRNVSLMRPRFPGADEAYPRRMAFTDEAKRMVQPFKVIRFMWAVDAWNGAWQVRWEDRVRPDYCSWNRGGAQGDANVGWAGKGMAWEAAIAFANEAGKDMWLNMPLGADDDYVRRLAALVRDTYTVPEGKVYWEYSNEATWDMSQVCANYLRQKGLEEAAAGGPVGWDGERTDTNILSARAYAKRAAEMSMLWREVWGDEAMMNRIRPVASGQLGYDLELNLGLDFIHDWYANGEGDFVEEPRPVSWFFYGCGASHYTGDDPEAVEEFETGQDAHSVSARQIEGFQMYEEEEACQALMYGLKRCAYEGGVWTDNQDYLLPRIEEAMIRYHGLWDSYGNDLLCYYVSTGGEDGGTALGFSHSALDLDGPKYRALDRILRARKATVDAGNQLPCRIPAADYSHNSVAWRHPAPGGAVTEGGLQVQRRDHLGYLFRVPRRGRYAISLGFRDVASSLMEIMVDGRVIAKESVSGMDAGPWILSLEAGLHALRVKKLDDAYFFLENVWIR